MSTIHNHSRKFANVLLSGIVSAALLLSSCSDGYSAPKAPAKPGGKAQRASSKRPGLLRLKRHAFPDVTMGIPAAYTVLLPTNWPAQGKIEWRPVGEVPFPQQIIEITSPQQGRIQP